jgi:hypothetical protein
LSGGEHPEQPFALTIDFAGAVIEIMFGGKTPFAAGAATACKFLAYRLAAT